MSPGGLIAFVHMPSVMPDAPALGLCTCCMQVTQATQSNTQTSVADIFRYFIYLASIINAALVANKLPDAILRHAVRAFNMRWEEMAVPIVRLALFLHPGYRILSPRQGEFDVLQKEVRPVICAVC